MVNLTLLDQEILWVLEKIEYCCESAELCNPEKVKQQKFLDISYTDKDHSSLEKIISTDKIDKYLQKNGVDFHLTYNFIDSPSDDYIGLGIIKGENIEDITDNVKKLIGKLKKKETTQEDIIKILINISPRHGIYKNGDTRTSYGIKGKRKKLVINLKDSSISGKKLANTYYDGVMSALSSEIKRINKKFTEKLSLDKSLIIHLKTAGYDFDRDEYDIQFIGF